MGRTIIRSDVGGSAHGDARLDHSRLLCLTQGGLRPAQAFLI